VRALRRLTRPDTAIIGVDHSPALIDAARRLTAEEGLSGNVTYQVGELGRSDLLPQTLVDDWRAFQAQAAVDNTFFGASNYYTYLTSPFSRPLTWTARTTPGLTVRLRPGARLSSDDFASSVEPTASLT
jgi:hypothetical protein